MVVNMRFYVQPTYSQYDRKYYDRIHIKSKINIIFPVNYYIYCFTLAFLDINKHYKTLNDFTLADNCRSELYVGQPCKLPTISINYSHPNRPI